MTKPRDMEKTNWRYQLAAIARDVSSITATVILLVGIFWAVAKPYFEPWLNLPSEIAEIRVQLAPLAHPRLVEFQGSALIANRKETYQPGDQIRFIYNLRRNADCATEINVSWFSVETGARITTSTERAVQAPITEGFSPFILSRTIPDTLPDGLWAYYPRINPLNCGVYRSYNANMSEIIRVKREI